MSVDALLSHLDGVRETGHGKYVARCPAHDDRSPSLAIKDCDDGKVLIHCFAGCAPEDILSAIGLTFSDMMPERRGGYPVRMPKPRFDARQVLEGISHEIMVVVLLTDKYAGLMNDEDEARLLLAAGRISTAMQAAPPLRTPPELVAIRKCV